MKKFFIKVISKGTVSILNLVAKNSINNVCHYMSYQEEEPESLKKYKKIKM